MTTAAIAVGSIRSITPAFAQTGNAVAAGSARQLVSDAATTAQQIESDAHFDKLLKQAAGLVIMPNPVKGAFVVGAQAGPAAMILMTNKALNDFTQSNNFSLNANAGVTIVHYSGHKQAPVGKGDVVIWSNQGGAFAGADISAADIMQNTELDRAYYGKQIDPMQILSGQTDQADADKLKSTLPS
jgi:lipid-binding SYLF domain-containing protein